MGKKSFIIGSFLFANIVGITIFVFGLAPANFNFINIENLIKPTQAEEPMDHAFFRSNFDSGKIQPHPNKDDGWYIQANPGDIKIVDAPGGKKGKALRVSISKTEDFAGVANGSPRAELLRPREFYHGEDYTIKWKTFLPDNFQFDNSSNEEIITQIHQDAASGSPPFALGLAGNKYFMVSDTPLGKQKKFFGNAEIDSGKWIDWTLHYKPSFSDEGLSELYKNGQSVAKFVGPNTYPNNDIGYLKIGIYKWFWKKPSYPSKVDSLTIYFDDISISQNFK
ncbi:MAG: heparin lyase I family protein [Candidatus Gastranaerophilales bacterium]|nr:heparin lyase I family protein [Candidatus Gastranaerophilales bacterium]